MKLAPLAKTLAIILNALILLATIAPVEAAAVANANADALPAFEKFVNAVKNGQAGVVRGVYAPGVLALQVRQQPSNEPVHVFAAQGVATQFGLAASYGVIGLLAHNYSSGGLFFNLAAGQEVRIVYGDGAVKWYIVSAIYQYQALDPTSPQSDFVELSSGATMSAGKLFRQMYTGGDRVVFQTCIQKGGNPFWGRMFVVAMPVN